MREEPIVDEIRKHRDTRAAKFGYDIHAIAEDARKREQESKRKVVSFVNPERHLRTPGKIS